MRGEILLSLRIEKKESQGAKVANGGHFRISLREVGNCEVGGTSSC
jgi:hypothetical protein